MMLNAGVLPNCINRCSYKHKLLRQLKKHENSRYLLTNTTETLQLLAEVNRPNLKYQYDIYHMQCMEGNLIDTLRKHIGMIGHIQVADSPERHEP